MIWRWLGEYLCPIDIDPVDWIDGPDEDDDENAREGFNEPNESKPEDEEQ